MRIHSYESLVEHMLRRRNVEYGGGGVEVEGRACKWQDKGGRVTRRRCMDGRRPRVLTFPGGNSFSVFGSEWERGDLQASKDHQVRPCSRHPALASHL